MLSLGKALPECYGGGKSTRPDRDSSPGPIAYRASTSSPNLLETVPVSTRQSLCCSQPEHGPTLNHQMSLGRKKHTARPGLEPRTFRIPCEHFNQLSYRAIRSTCEPRTSSIPCKHSNQLSYRATRSTCDMRVEGEGHTVICADPVGVIVGATPFLHNILWISG